MIELRFTAFGCMLLAMLVWWGSAIASTDPLFASQEVLEVTLVGPFNKVARDKAEEPEERPGQLSYVDASGVQQTLSVKLSPRGKSRRDRKVCTFPPLKLNLKKSEVKDTLFARQGNLKLVTHCRSSERYQSFLLKEFLVYRIFNELTPVSFNVRLMKITYEDSESKRDPFSRYGFVIEHKKRLAKRLDSTVMEPMERIAVNSLDSEQAAIAELFQYLVSNTDYSFIAPPVGDNCCHNAVLFDAGDGGYFPVPYDFDRTGLVSPPNGLPDATLGQRSFRDRVFRGFCHDDAVMTAALEKTRASRQAIEQLIASQIDLDRRSRDQTLNFVAAYYTIIDNEKKRKRELKCRELH
ncbi:MAG: hypothetical protein ACC642_04365 [Pseudomonadales bacterium]